MSAMSTAAREGRETGFPAEAQGFEQLGLESPSPTSLASKRSDPDNTLSEGQHSLISTSSLSSLYGAPLWATVSSAFWCVRLIPPELVLARTCAAVCLICLATEASSR